MNTAISNLYWPNGKIKRSIHFEGMQRSGSDRMWNEEGILVDEGSYEKGVPVGVHKRWNAKGRLIEEIIYGHEYRNWDDEGNLRTEAFWDQNTWIEKNTPRPSSYLISGAEIPPGSHEDGFAILMERYPLLGLLYPTWEAIPAQLEFLKPFDLGHAEAVIVYGLGMGAPYFQLKNWLHERPNRKLIFLEEQIAYFIATSPHVSILKDPQVYLETDPEQIPEKFPLQRVEVVALPSKKNKSLKLELLRKITLSHAIYQDRLYGHQPFQNFVQNIRRLPQSFYANALKDKFQGIPAIVCGAGPSLRKAIPLLKELSNKALIIAGGSTLAALSSQGVPIHFGMAIDPNLEEYRRLKNSFAFDTPLLYSSRVHPDVFQTCSGPFGFMRSGIGGILEVWMEEELGLFDPLIGQNLSPESISVTAVCVAWAQYLGCNTVFLSGVDLAYTDQKRYAAGVGIDEEISFKDLDAEKSAADRILRRKDRLGRPIHTAVRWVMEAAGLTHFAKKHKEICLINTTDGGLPIPGIPYMDLKDVDLVERFDLKKRVQEEVAAAQMPDNAEQVITGKMEELRASLNRVIEYLEVLAGEKKGSPALAELELQEEIASDFLFYDINQILGKEEKWKNFLLLARKYQNVL